MPICLNDSFKCVIEIIYHFYTISPLEKKSVRRQKLEKPWFSQELENMHRMVCEMNKIARSANNKVIISGYKHLGDYSEMKNIAKKTFNNDRLNLEIKIFVKTFVRIS